MTSGYPDWTRAMLLLGKHATDMLPVLLGADGSMYCVLQGEYGGELKTVHVDDQGRLSAFVIDSSDAWEQMLQIGNAELAVRLGSIVRLDRRGTVMLLDSFDDGCYQWVFDMDGATGYHALTPERACSGGYSLRLTAPTDGTLWIQAAATLPPCLITAAGFSVMMLTDTQNHYIEFNVDFCDGEYLHRSIVSLLYTTGKISVWTDAGAWQEVADYDTDVGAWAAFHLVKFVCDFGTAHYVRLLYDNHEYDISAIGLEKTPLVTIPRLYVTLNLYGKSGQPQAVAHFDDVIITSEI